jgi:hypothetical protein
LPIDKVAAFVADNETLGGPGVIAHDPTSLAADGGPFSAITLTFSEAMDPASFTVDDVSLEAPWGVAVSPLTIAAVVGSGDALFTVSFDARDMRGVYSLSVGPDILDLDGSAMDQKHDGVFGQPDDAFLADIEFTAAWSAVPTPPTPLFEDFEAVSPPPFWSLVSVGTGTVWLGSASTPHMGTGHRFSRDPYRQSHGQPQP